MRAITESKLLAALSLSDFVLVDPIPEVLNKKIKLPLQCKCGEVGYRRVSDIISGVKACRSCRAKEGNSISRTYNSAGTPKHKKYFTEQDKILRDTFSGAKRRCDPNTGHKNYGMRGIKFNFSSVWEAVLWAKEFLGDRPQGYTLDRIDNEGHYEPGNLRWADRTTQRVNQRECFRGNSNTERLYELCKSRPDYSYESLRSFVVSGMSDKEILEKRKGKHSGKKNRKNV